MTKFKKKKTQKEKFEEYERENEPSYKELVDQFLADGQDPNRETTNFDNCDDFTP